MRKSKWNSTPKSNPWQGSKWNCKPRTYSQGTKGPNMKAESFQSTSISMNWENCSNNAKPVLSSNYNVLRRQNHLFLPRNQRRSTKHPTKNRRAKVPRETRSKAQDLNCTSRILEKSQKTAQLKDHFWSREGLSTNPKGNKSPLGANCPVRCLWSRYLQPTMFRGQNGRIEKEYHQSWGRGPKRERGVDNGLGRSDVSCSEPFENWNR